MADSKIKSLLKEFKDFAMKGNVIDLAVGVIIGAAFGKVVTAVIEIFLNPILEKIQEINVLNGGTGTGFAGSLLSFLAVVVEFLLTALVLFIIIKVFNKAKTVGKKPEPKPEAPRLCPYCKMEVAKDATRCPHCTSVFDPVTATKK